MKKYIYILIIYIAMQLSGIIGFPLVKILGMYLTDLPDEQLNIAALGIWSVFSFIIATIIILLILRKAEPLTKIEKEQPLPLGQSILFAISGIFLALFAQILAIQVETLLGIEQGSENTAMIIDIIHTIPVFFVVTAIIGPILEEIVFRKIIFGLLYNRFSFFVASLISSLIFALAHGEPEHTILYASMGFIFAFLYVKTKRIIVPILSHMMMNTFVVIASFLLPEQLKEASGLLWGWIGGIFY